MMNSFRRLALVLLLACGGSFASAEDLASEASPPPGQQVGRHTSGFGPYPAPDSGYVTDVADLLSDSEEEQIERWLWRVESRTGVEIAVVTIRSMRDYPGAAQASIEAFAGGLFDRYGIGNMPANDGVLLLVSRDDREARIELGGSYGRARDGDALRIMDGKILPRFRQGEYGRGITDGVRAVMLEFAGVRIGTNWNLIGLLLAVPVVGLIAYSLFRSGKRGWGWVVVGFLIVLALALVTVVITTMRHMPRGSSGSWSSGGVGGGFGGGFSGGGGASGSW